MKKLILIVVVTLFITNISNAQITKVAQEVFGMDCAPCAYGLERGLKKMEGLQEVRVSLNDGKAYLDLSGNNELKLKQIQEEVKNNGFSAKKAEVILEGQLVEKEGSLIIMVNKEEYVVDTNTEQSIQNSLEPGKVRVRGIVKDEEDNKLTDSWKIQVTEIL